MTEQTPATEAERRLLQWQQSAGPSSVFLAELRAYADALREPLDVELLAAVIHDWVPDGAGVADDATGHHLSGSDLARFLNDKAAKYKRFRNSWYWNG